MSQHICSPLLLNSHVVNHNSACWSTRAVNRQPLKDRIDKFQRASHHLIFPPRLLISLFDLVSPRPFLQSLPPRATPPPDSNGLPISSISTSRQFYAFKMLKFNVFLLLVSCTSFVDSWWLLSKADTSSQSSTSSLLCKNVPGLTPQQKRMCLENPHVIKYLISGLRSALHTCENTFQREAWNCTLTVPGIGTSPLQIASRESAYVYAISAAGVSHSLARACSKGLIDECGCGETPQGSDSDRSTRSPTDFVWAGCSDNVKFGNAFGRKFVDQYDKQHASEPRSQMNLHNNRVGRRLLVNAMNKECKCHGVSGSCVTKTCWKVMPKFDEFAARLHDKYQLAKLVTTNDQKLFVRSTPSAATTGRSERYVKTMDASSKQMRNELIYLDASPNYCAIDVKDRECGENCANICCGRGWRTTREIVDEPCHCQFVWCCEVKCKTCKKLVERNYCL